jgi:hypothetical protein
MDSINLRLFFVYSLFFLLSACGSSIADVTDSRLVLGATNPAGPSSDLASLTGRFVGLDSKTKNLESFEGKPVVLVFAQDLCSDCYDEHEAWIGSLKDSKLAPENVHIITVLVGATNADATAWQKDVKAPWTVGIDNKLALYKSYFGDAFGTPALVVGVPGKGVQYKHIGITKRTKVEEFTGAWE